MKLFINLKLPAKEETDILKKRVENLEKKNKN